jgi:hypothetical protein
MNYEKHYSTLIERSRNRILEGYVEKHHIVPRCLGGGDDRENIAVLTPEEHFLAHQLLVKMYPGNRDLIYATQLMTVHHTNARMNNKLFGWLRKQCAAAMSTQMKTWYVLNSHPKGMLNKKHTDAKKKQIGASVKKAMIETVGVTVYAYNLDGSFYKEYATLTDCATDLKTSPSNVKYTAEGKFGHCCHKQLRYEFTETVPQYVSPHAGIKKQKYTCPHCKKEGAGPAMKRFHFDNCKHKKDNQ